jgi:hypothetical protein
LTSGGDLPTPPYGHPSEEGTLHAIPMEKATDVHVSWLDFAFRSKSPNPLKKGALKVPLFKGDLGGFTPTSPFSEMSAFLERLA